MKFEFWTCYFDFVRTGEMIQRTIREKFSDSTVITVAHRINTVIDSDRVLVLDDGVAVEYDEPYILLQNVNGAFRAMVEALGTQEFHRLFLRAKEKYEENDAHRNSITNAKERN